MSREKRTFSIFPFWIHGGNPLEKNDNGVITTYAYDDNDRLASSTEDSVTTTYTYDDNGNMLTKTGNSESYTFSYNALNQLTHADITTGAGSSSMDYVYDHDGIRVGKTVNGTDVTRYIVDKNRPYAQVLEEQRYVGNANATTISYVYGDTLLSQVTDGIPHYYLYDGMHSVRGLADSAGTLTDAYTYDAYGNLLDNSGPTSNSYLYRGEQFDADLDAYYLRARYYQPDLGRFLATDPVEGFPTNPITQHRYIYGNNNPLNYLDPSGRSSLVEKLIVTKIVLTLAGTAVNLGIGVAGDSSWGQNVMYPFLAEHIYPEAYVMGINLSITSPSLLFYLLTEIVYPLFGQAEVPNMQNAIANTFTLVGSNTTVAGGIELVSSLGSGERGLFATATIGAATLTPPTLSGGIELYDGFVYNLWNLWDYHGPFESLSVGAGSGFDSSALSFGWNLFWDSGRGFDGPWGGGRTFWSFSIPKYGFALSMGKAHTYYQFLEDTAIQRERISILNGIIALNLAKALLESLQGSVSAAFSFPFDVTNWTNIAVAHDCWNTKEPQYDIDTRRRITDRKKVPDYRSGPSYWLISGL